MLTPKVIETRRGSAHRVTAITAIAAAVPHRRTDGGRSWNSGI
jgi:hypothetical protein